ncbi:uncharacterized protein K444DRAFT_419842 [Hyaloscypha bicolor E]|uniref:Uncharacterized protein n=1 Tax=Hyaloscypha bicolor E TaxID=1095630 RepID=A0A2J6T7G2_9HELO|nr:uncharacterized protein K444DRAFT_419842 [Hyaloscypha bicolor E]PMD58960.1 hypothetical protein K444DRAFT_419842 [Hyaloscypha bicolor E]
MQGGGLVRCLGRVCKHLSGSGRKDQTNRCVPKSCCPQTPCNCLPFKIRMSIIGK